MQYVGRIVWRGMSQCRCAMHRKIHARLAMTKLEGPEMVIVAGEWSDQHPWGEGAYD